MFSLSPFPLAREPTVTAWRGTTLGRDITYAIYLIVPLRFVRRLRNNMAQSLVLFVKSDARFARRRCGSCSVFEVAKSVNQYALNKFPFRAQPKNAVILSLSKDLVETKQQTFSAPVPQLLIISCRIDEIIRSIVRPTTLLVSAIFGVRQGKAVRKAIPVY